MCIPPCCVRFSPVTSIVIELIRRAKHIKGPGMPRQNINIEVIPGCKEQLKQLRQRNGMTQRELMARLIEWFCQQDQVVQQTVLGQIPESIAPDVARMLLARMSDAGNLTRAACSTNLVGEIG